MSDFNQPLPRGGYASTPAVKNRVLRNTYWLLAASLIPTILGAALALQLNLNTMLSPGISTIVFLAGAFGLMFAVERNKNNSAGIVWLMAFTFFMGIMLSRMLGFVLSMNNGAQLIMMAFGGTAAIFATMATIATTSKRDFTGMQKTLFIGAVVLILAAIGNIFLQIPALMLTISVLAMIIFSAFMLVDIQRIVNGGETNYISATMAIYLDIYNVFVSLLSILGITGGSSD